MTNPLDELARHVETDPSFLGSILTIFAQSEELDDAGLASAVGCAPQMLSRLKLCRSPRVERFVEDAETIAAHFGLDVDRLIDAIRRGLVIQQWRRKPASGVPGPLLAARDEEPPETPS